MQGYPQQQQYPAGQARPGFAPNGAQASYGYQAPQQRSQQAIQAPQRQTAAPVAAQQQQAQLAERRRVNSINLGDGDGQYRQAKKRKATDKSLPTFTPSSTSAITLPAAIEAKNATLAALSSSYSEMQKIERKLDWTLARKRVEYSEAANQQVAGGHIRPARIRKKFRVTVSNTCSNQLWQGAAQGEKEVDFATGEGVPSWSLKVEGALLDPGPGQTADDYRFTRLIQKVVIDASRSDMAGQDHVHSEWERKQDTVPQDGLTVDGRGSSNLTAQISLWPIHFPECFVVNPELGSMLGITEAARADMISALWTYIRKNNLLDPDDRKQIRCDAYLTKLWVAEPRLRAQHIERGDLKIPITSLPELLIRHTGRLPPVKLDYTIKVDGDPASSSQYWDLEIDIDDPVRLDMVAFLKSMQQQSTSSAALEQLSKVDDTISEAASKVRAVKSRRDALAAFSADPVAFLRVWLSSQSTDIDQLLSGADRSHQALSGATAEDLRHAEFYRAPWLADAINLHQGRLFGDKVRQAVANGTAQTRR